MTSSIPEERMSDSRFAFIVFGLITVIVALLFLVYFIYGQNKLVAPADDPTFEKTSYSALDKARNADEKTDTKTVDNTSPKIENKTANASLPDVSIAESVPASTVSTVVSEPFDPNRYNPRTSETASLRGRDLLLKYFSSIQISDYETACSLLSNTICNARRDIYSFSRFLEKTSHGYEVISMGLAKEQKPTESIFCVQYTYTLKADLNPHPVTEYFQYRVKSRPDGTDEISARVCEKIIKDGGERPCPIVTPKKYCS